MNLETATSLLKSEAGYLFLTHTVSDVGVVVDTDPLTDAGRFMGLGVFGVFGGLGVAVGVEVFTVVVGGTAFKVGGGGGGGGDNNGGGGGDGHGRL